MRNQIILNRCRLKYINYNHRCCRKFALRASRREIVLCTPEERRLRIVLLSFFVLAWSALIICRLASLQITGWKKWRNWAKRQHLTSIKIASERGPIFDRAGRIMSISVPVGSIYARPGEFKDMNDVAGNAKILARLLSEDEDRIKKLISKPKPFVWIKRQVPRKLAEKIEKMKLNGIGSVLESKRYYPFGSAASALIGRVGIDGDGLSGLELAYDRILKGKSIRTKLVRDGYGNPIEPQVQPSSFSLPRGDSLRLTIDAHIQQIMDEELEKGRVAANAKGAMAVMIDSSTGELLGMSQAPAADFNVENVRRKDLINRVVETVYEPGSTLKPFVAAAALDLGVVTPEEIINCQMGVLHFGRKTIRDVHPMGEMTFRDVLIRSSNIGMTKIGIKMGAEKLHNALSAFGFGEYSGIGIRGESRGILRDTGSWSAIDVATHSFGQGVAVTPLQMVRAVAALVNGGKLYPLRIEAGSETGIPRRVISPEAAQTIKDILIAVVEDPRGTGRRAAVPGIIVGGKTGTAQKPAKNRRGYAEGLYVASFLGFADASGIGLSKQPSLLVVIDEPHADSIYGGTLAAPTFSRIMHRTISYLATTKALKSGPYREERYRFAKREYREGLIPVSTSFSL